MLNPRAPAAVVAGNVEVSTCVTNALFAALGVMAGAQPTMNNLTFGNSRHQVYETISGGAGAGGRFDAAGMLVGGFDGASVVQTHMTNSRLTDPEVLELRFPVRLESYSIRRNSGGVGRWRGGDGGTRRIRFLEPMTVAILSNGRQHPAAGLAAGGCGAPGKTWIERADGSVTVLKACDRAQVQVGDQVIVETPGGGGFGAAQ
jgi:5-oxoprolinase (ATP-hydrolysing)